MTTKDTISTFEKHLEGKRLEHKGLDKAFYTIEDVQKAKQEALKAWFKLHRTECNVCGAMEDRRCGWRKQVETAFGRIE